MNDKPFTRGEWTSASNAQADALCPGRHNAQRGLPEVESGDASHGTVIHSALKLQNPAGLDFAQTETFDACRKIEERELRKIFGVNYDKTVQFREKRLHVTVPANPDPRSRKPTAFYPHSGQLDCFYLMEGTGSAAVIDYKCLPGDVPTAARNEQIRDQIVLLARQPGYPLTEVIGLVIQPLVTHSPEPVLYDEGDIRFSEAKMFNRVIASNSPNAPRVAGEVQCKYCLARNVCVEYGRFAGQMVPGVKSLLDVPVASWTPAQRAEFLDKRKIAQKWLDECEEAIKSIVVADPGAVPGWSLKEGATKEAIADSQAAFERFLAAGGTPEQFMGAVSVGKGKLKECLATATGLKGMKLKEALDTILMGIVTTKQNAPSLVKLDPLVGAVATIDAETLRQMPRAEQ